MAGCSRLRLLARECNSVPDSEKHDRDESEHSAHGCARCHRTGSDTSSSVSCLRSLRWFSGGSRAAATSDVASDCDLYVYTVWEVPVDFRRTLLGESAEIDNRFWEPGDEWSDPSTGTHIDIMYRSPEWIEGQIERILSRHEASLGYTTCFWYNIVHSEALLDPRGWYQGLQNRGRVAYPEGLRRAVLMKNWPVLRRNHSSYRHQIEVALNRGDIVSAQHRVTAFLASFFDVWFALERKPHPGEKRLLSHLSEPWGSLVRALTEASPGTLLKHIDALVDRVDAG